MSDERIEVNQPFRLIITCYKDGALVDLADTTLQQIEYRNPAGVATEVTATILNPPGTDGKIYYDFAKNIVNVINKWKAKPWLTFLSSDKLPGEPIDIEIYDEWES